MRSPWNSLKPHIWFILSNNTQKVRKSLDQNLISSEGDHDTHECKIADHSFHSFYLECPETPISLKFWPTERRNQAKIKPVLYVVMVHLHTKISGHSFHAFFSEWPQTRNSLSFLANRRPELSQYSPKSNHFWRWSRYISMPHFRIIPFMHFP